MKKTFALLSILALAAINLDAQQVSIRLTLSQLASTIQKPPHMSYPEAVMASELSDFVKKQIIQNWLKKMSAKANQMLHPDHILSQYDSPFLLQGTQFDRWIAGPDGKVLIAGYINCRLQNSDGIGENFIMVNADGSFDFKRRGCYRTSMVFDDVMNGNVCNFMERVSLEQAPGLVVYYSHSKSHSSPMPRYELYKYTDEHGLDLTESLCSCPDFMKMEIDLAAGIPYFKFSRK